VTVIDWRAKVFAIDMVHPGTCDLIRSLTQQHVQRLADSGCEEGGYRALYTYTKLDIPTREIPGVAEIAASIMIDVCRVYAALYSQPQAAFALCPRSWKEPHILKYQKVPGKE